jgi:2-phospho-L-lactate guanylyltransferase (CobY/MobA/RfbA family)
MVKVDGKVKLGRPTKDVKLDRLLHVRVDPALLERINAAAREQGVSTSQWLRLSAAVWVDSPADLVRALAADPGAERTQLVARTRSRSGKGARDGSAA